LDDRHVTLVDTGGFDPGIEDEFGVLAREHARVAADEADLVIFLMDGKEGLLYGDMEIARFLQKSSQKPVIYAVNKIESSRDADSLADFYRLGVDNILSLSAKNRIGISDLIEALFSHIPVRKFKPCSNDETVVALIGRPNVGKSSFINKLTGSERHMVSSTAGTTRDPVDSLLRHKNRTIRFIDTAGIRKKSSISYSLEKYCVLQSLKSMNRAPICILMIDAEQGVSTQDAKLAAQIYDRKRACIIAVNKWDLIEKDSKTHDSFIKTVRRELAFIDFAPIITVSALTGLRVRNVFDVIFSVKGMYESRIPTPALNKGIQEICAAKAPPRSARSKTNIYYAVQVDIEPPTFKLFTNSPSSIPEHYRRYLERSIRGRFGITNVPVSLQLVKRTGSTKSS